MRAILFISAFLALATSEARAQLPVDPKSLVSTFFELQLDPPVLRKLFEVPEYRSCGSLRMGPDGKRIFVLAPDKTAAAPAGN